MHWQWIKEHIGPISSFVGAIAAGGAVLWATLKKGEEQIVAEAMDKILGNPKFHHLLVKYRPQIEAAWETASKVAKEKLDAAN